MRIIKMFFYGLITVLNVMPLKMFRRLCERYVNDDDTEVEAVLVGYMVAHQLAVSKHYALPDDVKSRLDEFLQGSKLEVIFQLNSPKLWNLFVESVSARHLSLPEQFILVEKMPVEYFCKMYVNRDDKVNFFNRQVGLDLFNLCKTLGVSSPYYRKLEWYVRYCKLSYVELKLFIDLFVDETKYDKAEPEKGFCTLFREWMMAEGAAKKDFASYEKILDYGLAELENIQRLHEIEIKSMQYSGIFNY